MACRHGVLEWIDPEPMNCSFTACVWFRTTQATAGSRRYRALIGMFSFESRTGMALLPCYTIV